MIIGARVQERLAASAMSQAELARRVGLSQPTIFQLIHRSKKGSTRIHAIARELGTTPAYLEGETDDPDADAPDPPTLTHDERDWVELYRQLGPSHQAALRTLAQGLIRQPESPTIHAPRLEYDAGAGRL